MPVSINILAQRQVRHDRRMAKAKEVVPQGPYCYRPGRSSTTSDGRPGYTTRMCPYYKRRGDWRRQQDGYCRLLKTGDSSKGRDSEGRPRATMILWDQVKECGVNNGLEDREVFDEQMAEME